MALISKVFLFAILFSSVALSQENKFSASILIPLDGDIFYQQELKMVALLQGEVPPAFGLLIDGYPIKEPVRLRDGYLTAELPQLSPGLHYVTLLFLGDQAQILFREEKSFFVRIPEPERKAYKTPFRSFGKVSMKSEYQGGEAGNPILSQSKIQSTDSNLVRGEQNSPLAKYASGGIQGVYNAVYNRTEASAKVLLRTTETPFRQPAHRLSARIKYRPWVGLKMGDIYPHYNELVLSDLRVRGVEGELNVIEGDTKWGSFDFVTGQSKRAIPAHINEIRAATGTRLDTTAGTFAQRIWASRLGFGGGPSFNLGITALKAWDDFSSIDTTINDSLLGPSPIDNFVTGIDLRFGFMENKLLFYLDAGLSLFTTNTRTGPFKPEESDADIPITPSSFENVFIINHTTAGLPYLVQTDTTTTGSPGHSPDPGSFFRENSTYKTGMRLSMPFETFSSETGVEYSHLGTLYHSEGNPFIGSNPKRGYSLLQKVLFWENKMSTGVEFGSYSQDFGLLQQHQTSIRGDIRYTPGHHQPSLWLGGGLTRNTPEENSPVWTASSFISFQSGGYYAFQVPYGKLHTSVQYAFAENEIEINFDAHPDSGQTVKAQTNILSASTQFKPKGLEIIPRLGYSLADNGIQLPTNNIVSGLTYYLFRKKLMLDGSVSVGQYPQSNTQNDLKLGQGFEAAYYFNSNASMRFRERFTMYGDRNTFIVGIQYDNYF